MPETIIGSESDDVLFGREGLLVDTVIWALGGNDRIFAYEGNDTIHGGAGNDTIFTGTSRVLVDAGIGEDTIWLGSGDTLDGGVGIDTVIDYQSDESEIRTVYIDFENGTHYLDIEEFAINYLSNIEVYSLVGNWHVNATGDAANNMFFTGSGNDSLRGGDGGDEIVAGDGNDYLDGGTDADTLSGGDGNDTLVADNVGDLVLGGSGYDTAVVENTNGSATFVNLTYWRDIEELLGSASSDSINASRYSKSLILQANSGNDTVLGTAFDDEILGGAGDDSLEGGPGADTLNGGSGADSASYGGAASGVSVDLDEGSRNSGEAWGDVHVSIENLVGSDFNDALRASGKPNTIFGGGGNDFILARSGDDSMFV